MAYGRVVRHHSEWLDIASSLLVQEGVPEARSRVIAAALVDADRKGVHSHGLMRLPLYVSAIRSGGIDPVAEITWEEVQPGLVLMDASGAPGQIAMDTAVNLAKGLLTRHGCAVIGIRGSAHYGSGGYWTEMLARDGSASILMSTTGKSVAPYGSAESFLGTNPITISFPASGRPITADFATSAGAYGRIVRAAQDGESIPDDWAMDEDGRPTTDPQVALAGSLRSFGGHKGSALATMVELLAAAATGGKFSHEVTDIWDDPSSRMGTGHLLIAFNVPDPSGTHAYAGRVDQFREGVRSLKPRPGQERVFLPGELEADAHESALSMVSVPESVWRSIQQLTNDDM